MKILGPRAFDLETLKMVDLIDQPAALWRREIYEQCGPLAEDLHYAFDWDFFIRCAQQTTGIACPRPIAAYRFHESNKTTGLNIARTEELISISLKHLPIALRVRFIFIVPLLRFLKKMIRAQVQGVWAMRKLANIILFLFRTDWFFRLIGIPLELRLVYGFGRILPDDLVKLKISHSPAYTTSAALSCFPEVWEVPK